MIETRCGRRQTARHGLAIAAFTLAWAGSSPAGAQHARFETVTVVPLVVKAVPFRGSPERPDQAQALQSLSKEATTRAERTLLKQHIAQKVEKTSSPAASAPLVLTGTVRLPVSIPAGERGGRAMFRGGQFATATVTLRRSDGTLVAEGRSSLRWGDVRWLRGVRIRRSRNLDDVLQDAVRKATDHAVKSLSSRTGGLLALRDSRPGGEKQ